MVCVVMQFLPSQMKVVVCPLVSKGWQRCSRLPMSWRGVGGPWDSLNFLRREPRQEGGKIDATNFFRWLPCFSRLQRLNLPYVLSQRDLVVIRSVAMFFAGLVILVNFLVDLSYLWLDPRMRARR